MSAILAAPDLAACWIVLALGFTAGTAGLIGRVTSRELAFAIHHWTFNAAKAVAIVGAVIGFALCVGGAP